MRITITTALFFALASVASAATVYSESDYPGSAVIPDLKDPAPSDPTLEFEITTFDGDPKLAYSFSFDGKDYEGEMLFVGQSFHAPGIAPSIRNYSDLTAGTGIDGGHVTLSMFANSSTPGIDADDLFGGFDAALLTFDNHTDNPTYATIAVPEPATSVLGGLGALCLLGFRRFGMYAAKMVG